MLIQLSDWQVAKTSLSIASTFSNARSKRRRSSSSRKHCNNQSQSHPAFPTTSLPAALSFVPHGKRPRPSKRKKGNYLVQGQLDKDESTPTLAVTTAHGVCVLGTSRSHSDGNDDWFKQNTRLQETSNMMYTSRPGPGNQSSFIPIQSSPNKDTHKSDLHSAASIPVIPAFVDIKHDRVFALQANNTALVAWNTAAQGPDAEIGTNHANGDEKAKNTHKCLLPRAAVSMAVSSNVQNHPGIVLVYGTLCDSRFYVASWSLKDDTWKCHLFDASKALTMVDETHVCTVLSTTTISAQQNHQRKRKGPTGSSGSMGMGGNRNVIEAHPKCVLTQVFANKKGFFLLQHHLAVMGESVVFLQEETLLSRLAVVSKQDDASIDPCCIQHALNDHSIIVSYQEVATQEIMNGKKQHTVSRVHRASHISLEAGALVGTPFAVSESIRHIGLVGENLLAAGTLDSILFYEITRGALVRSFRVTEVVANTDDWIMITDHSNSSLALLSARPNGIHVAKTTVNNPMSFNAIDTVTLADGLRSAMMISTTPVKAPNHHDIPLIPAKKNLLSFMTTATKNPVDGSTVDPSNDGFLQDSLASLSACMNTICDPKNDITSSTNLLLNAFEAAMAKLKLPLSSSTASSTQKTTTTTPIANGITPTNTVKSWDHSKFLSDHALLPPSLPQPFIDEAVPIMIAILRLPKTRKKGNYSTMIELARLDARGILYRLIRTGKVSARRHFPVLASNASSKEKGNITVDNDDADGDDDDVLLSVLRAMKLTNKRGKRVISPVDLIHGMLSSCMDLTERHLVTMIHYLMCKALPHDIAENCLGWKCFGLGHPWSNLSKAYFRAKSTEYKLLSQKDSPEVGEQIKQTHEVIDQLSTKLHKIGLLFLVERATSYSKLNTSLLRTALMRGLIHKSEAPTLARALLDVLASRTGGGRLASTTMSSTITRREANAVATAKWIFVLCEACRDTLSIRSLSTTETVSNTSNCHMEYILRRLEVALEDTNHILSLGTSLESWRSGLHRSYEGDSLVPLTTAAIITSTVDDDVESATRDVSKKEMATVRPVKLAGYCIEQLML